MLFQTRGRQGHTESAFRRRSRPVLRRRSRPAFGRPRLGRVMHVAPPTVLSVEPTVSPMRLSS